MDAIQFTQNYESYLYEIDLVIKPELKSLLEELRHIDPHDLVAPNTWFESENAAKGYIWKMFLSRVKNSINFK